MTIAARLSHCSNRHLARRHESDSNWSRPRPRLFPSRLAGTVAFRLSLSDCPPATMVTKTVPVPVSHGRCKTESTLAIRVMTVTRACGCIWPGHKLSADSDFSTDSPSEPGMTQMTRSPGPVPLMIHWHRPGRRRRRRRAPRGSQTVQCRRRPCETTDRHSTASRNQPAACQAASCG